MTSTAGPTVAASNADAYAAWDGYDGTYWTDHDALFDASMARYQPHLLAAAAIADGEHALDIGCGTGQTTRDVARLTPNGSAEGIDLSSRMIECARARAAAQGLTNTRFTQADAQIHQFVPASFDAAVSRTGVMFFGDPVAAFTNIGHALRPGGRLALMVWRSLADNPWITDLAAALAAGRDLPEPMPDAPGPMSLADRGRAGAVLSAAGFADVTFDPIDEPLCFGGDTTGAGDFVAGFGFTRFMLRDLDEQARTRALAELHATIAAHDTGDGVWYPSAVWIIRARRG